jgi:hypothetical protein
MIVILTLGGVIFQDFEIPESIRAGGEQKLDVKKFIGGRRIIDAMGSDDAEIEWSGRFRGSTAEQRCQQLDGMRKSGQAVQLTWSSFNYQVVIKSFVFDYQSPMEIPYRISLEVEIDNTVPIPSLLQGIDEIFGTNLATALNFGSEANVAGVTTGLNELETEATTIGILSGATPAQLSSLTQSISSVQGVTQTSISTLAGQTLPAPSSVFGATGGLPPQTIVANVAGQASAFAQLSNLIPLNSVLSVMSKNVMSVGP